LESNLLGTSSSVSLFWKRAAVGREQGNGASSYATHRIPASKRSCDQQCHPSEEAALICPIIALFGDLQSYQLARAYSAVNLPADTKTVAQSHGLAILALERKLGIDVELSVQRYVLSLPPWAMETLGHVYYSHIVLGVAFLGYMYTYRPDVFPRIRRTMAVCNVIAYAIMSVYRVAPPRLLPKSEGFVDVLHAGQEHTAWTQNRFQLIYAAMPSLHFGNSFLVGLSLFLFAPHRPIRALAPLWPAAMLLTITATANHYILDACIGACIPVLAYRWNQVLLNLRALEEWAFWLCRVEKPPRAPGMGPWAKESGGMRPWDSPTQRSVVWKDAGEDETEAERRA
jgi:hypothetical protein